MEFWIGKNKIKIEIKRKPNKNLYMRFLDTQTLLITCNRFVSEKEIEKIIVKNEKTLKKMYIQKQKEEEKNTAFYYLGQKYNQIYDAVTKEPYFIQNGIVAKDEKTLEKYYKDECHRVFQSEIDRILPYFQNIPTFTLKIRNMKTRWGVNNRGNNTITLNSELLKRDLDLIDYVIIHELCHFYEPNHSEAFWRHVEKYYPKYKEARKRLRE